MLYSPKKIPTFSQKKRCFKENMILVGSWKVELDFRVLAPTSIYRGLVCSNVSSGKEYCSRQSMFTTIYPCTESGLSTLIVLFSCSPSSVKTHSSCYWPVSSASLPVSTARLPCRSSSPRLPISLVKLSVSLAGLPVSASSARLSVSRVRLPVSSSPARLPVSPARLPVLLSPAGP